MSRIDINIVSIDNFRSFTTNYLYRCLDKNTKIEYYHMHDNNGYQFKRVTYGLCYVTDCITLPNIIKTIVDAVINVLDVPFEIIVFELYQELLTVLY